MLIVERLFWKRLEEKKNKKKKKHEEKKNMKKKRNKEFCDIFNVLICLDCFVNLSLCWLLKDYFEKDLKKKKTWRKKKQEEKKHEEKKK